MKRPQPTFADSEQRRLLLQELKAAMREAVDGAAPGAKPISLWDGLRAAVREVGHGRS